MSKAEERALEKYPYKEGYDVELPYPSTYDENKDQREAFIEGYHQAEKDLELTWEDVSLLRSILFDVEHEGFTKFPYEEFCKEVLKRFKAQKGE